jgi:hypothetical protein
MYSAPLDFQALALDKRLTDCGHSTVNGRLLDRLLSSLIAFWKDSPRSPRKVAEP